VSDSLDDLKYEYYAVRAPGAESTDSLADLEYKFFSSAGGPTSPTDLPFYAAEKVSNINSINTLWTHVLTLGPLTVPAGQFEGGFAVTWLSTDLGSTLLLRERINAGTWSTYAQNADSVMYWRSFFFQYPTNPLAAGDYMIELEARLEGTGAIDIKYADLWVRHVHI